MQQGLARVRLWLALGLGVWMASAQAWKGEMQPFEAQDTFGGVTTFQSTTFQQVYDTPPVVVTLPTVQGANVATIRFQDVTSTGFESSIVESRRQDGPHVAMDTAYIAIEPGMHLLPDGRTIVAGFVDTTRVQKGSGVSGVAGWENVAFGYTFDAPPTILANVQTSNNEQGESGRLPPRVSSIPWLTTAVGAISTTSVQLALERSQAYQGTVTQAERIAYIAIENGASGQFVDNNGATIQYLAQTSAPVIDGWSNGGEVVNFSVPFANTPLLVATKNGRNNADGGWLRRDTNFSGSQVRLRIDEDTEQDNERSVGGAERESAGLFAVSQGFVLDLPPAFTVEKSSEVIWDPVNLDTYPKAIPGAVVEYTLTVTNEGYDYSDDDTFMIADSLPADTDLVVIDINGAGSGPVTFTDGASSSGTSWDFGGLSDAADSLEFSTDGVDFSYSPSADADGVDSAVSAVRLRPQGQFAADPNNPPTATYRYRVKIR